MNLDLQPALRNAGDDLAAQVLELSRLWKRGNSVSANAYETAHKLLDHPGFDAALISTQNRIADLVGDDSINHFLAWLKDCAGLVLDEQEGAPGARNVRVHHLFVVPVEGLAADAEGVLRSQQNLDILVQSFEETPVVAPGEKIKFGDTALGTMDLANARPGEIRRLLRLTMSSEPTDVRRSRELINEIKRRSRSPVPPQYGTRLCQRAYIGLSASSEANPKRVPVKQSVPPGGDRFALWIRRINRALKMQDVNVRSPLSWNRAIAEMTICQIQRGFELAILIRDNYLGSVSGKILHVAAEPSGVIVMALERDDDVIGPICIPAALVSHSGDAIAASLQSLAVEVREHDDVNDLPLTAAFLH